MVAKRKCNLLNSKKAKSIGFQYTHTSVLFQIISNRLRFHLMSSKKSQIDWGSICRLLWNICRLNSGNLDIDQNLIWPNRLNSATPLTSLQFIPYHVAGFYKPTIPQSPLSHLRVYSTCNNVRLEISTIFVPSFDPNKWCLKNGLHSGGLNPGPLGHELSALTIRLWLLAK